ncbi:MAG TPA: LLM class F420-dependent oxidoreductase [Dehalococcoidia bacterium]|nr:LLM class F420-dependent oxidoreductase [Dehalococcoidia bacterium]
MQYGVGIFPTDYTLQPDELGRRAEERGFDSLWVTEHTHIPVSRKTPWPGGPVLPKEYLHTYDPFVALTAAAAATRDLKVATGICLLVQRDPITTAKEVASLDRLSGGRFLFGIGGGWNIDEIENHGTQPKTRFRLLRERVLAMKSLWTQEEAEFHGRFVNFDKAWSYPKPLQQPHPPILMGGDGPTTFDRVVEFCDGWLPICRGGVAPPGIDTKVPELRRRAEAAGRDPASISVTVYFCPPDREVIDSLARIGVDRVVFALPSAEPPRVIDTLDNLAGFVS